MKPIKIIKNALHNGTYYLEGEEIIPTKDNIEVIDVLNVGGFIEPLTATEFIKLKAEVNKPKFVKKIEEE